MTAQASDRITYRDQEFSLVGWEGAGLFDPAQHGLKPFQVSTGNWVGYICTYAVADDTLRLERLEIGFGADDRAASLRGEGPLLFGVRPRLTEQDSYAVYERLGQIMPFSGTLTLGADFVWSTYVHMGFHPPWKYRVVWDLTFEAGKLVAESDRSADMARMREAEASGGLAGLFKPLDPNAVASQGGAVARIRPSDIFDHLNPQMRAALDEAVARTLPGVEVDKRQLYLEFRRALALKLKQWENVPNGAVDAD